jgi:hypothetical protein
MLCCSFKASPQTVLACADRALRVLDVRYCGHELSLPLCAMCVQRACTWQLTPRCTAGLQVQPDSRPPRGAYRDGCFQGQAK